LPGLILGVELDASEFAWTLDRHRPIPMRAQHMLQQGGAESGEIVFFRRVGRQIVEFAVAVRVVRVLEAVGDDEEDARAAFLRRVRGPDDASERRIRAEWPPTER